MAEQTIRIMCPNLSCRRVLAVPIHARGKLVRCRGCGTNIRIPSGGGNHPAPPASTDRADEQVV